MRISELVRYYRLLNDPQAPDWNVKFVGAGFVAAMLLVAAGAAFWPRAAAPDEQATAGGFQARSDEATEFVGPGECDAVRVAQALAEWEAAHAGATVLAREPVLRDGCVVGHDVRYTP